jgi:cytochrome P450
VGRDFPGFTDARFRRFRDVPELMRDGPNVLLRMQREHGDRVRIRIGVEDFLLLSDVRDVRHVLVTNATGYAKSEHYRGLKAALGRGLVTSEGALWRRQRRLIQPAFRPAAIEALAPTMVECTASMLADWRREGPATFDIHEAMMALTFRIAGLTLFGQDLAGHAAPFAAALEEALAFANDYAEALLPLPLWAPTPRHRSFRRAMGTLDGILSRIIEEKRAAPGESPDLLSAMIHATDDEGQMSVRQLRDEAMTLLVAGHETTAVALSWTFWLLARHPAIAGAVREEARALGDGVLDASAAHELPLTRRVLQEAMRLRPPVWMVERQPHLDDTLPSGARIPGGAVVGISAWILHRHEDHWQNPEGFDPERFTDERSADRDRYAYLPFGAGPRVCIGGSFAMTEATLLLAMILRDWRLELAGGQRVRFIPGITLRPTPGIRMRRVQA